MNHKNKIIDIESKGWNSMSAIVKDGNIWKEISKYCRSYHNRQWNPSFPGGIPTRFAHSYSIPFFVECYRIFNNKEGDIFLLPETGIGEHLVCLSDLGFSQILEICENFEKKIRPFL